MLAAMRWASPGVAYLTDLVLESCICPWSSTAALRRQGCKPSASPNGAECHGKFGTSG